MSIYRWKDKDVVHIYNGILLSHKKSEIMPFAATQVQLEVIILSEVRKTNQIPYEVIHMWNLKNDTNKPIYEAETYSLTERTD